MPAEELTNSDADQLEAILARYLLQLEAGTAPSRQQLLEAYPQWAEQLQAFLNDHQRMQGLLGRRSGSMQLVPGSSDPTLAPHLAEATLSFDALTPPARFGDYQLLEEIQRGGMGIVFKAYQISLARVVALKIIKSGQLAGTDEIRRFRAEAEAAASLNHPGIVSIYEVGQLRGIHYLAMEYVEGPSLAAYAANRPLPPREAASLVARIAQAVADAHQHGVIHRDLKPANVLLDHDHVPKIADFGLAKQLRRQHDLTASGQILGTPAFMAPEQAAGDRHHVDERADIYSIGAILYALCTGQPPYQACNEVDVLLKVLDSEPLPPSRLNRNLPRTLELICLRCLEKEPSRRYATAQHLADDLVHFLRDEPIEAQSVDLRQRLRRWARRESVLAAHLGAILGFLVLLQIAHLLIGADLWYHLRHAGTLSVWALSCLGLQQLLARPRWRTFAAFLWAATDVTLLTVVLTMAQSHRGPLLIGYPALIVAAGLFLRVRLVVFTSAAASIAYLTLVVLHPEEAIKPHYCAFFVLGLIVIGSMVAAQVRRTRALSQYYDDAC